VSKPFVFALTPPEPAFEDVYELGIKGACDVVGAYCERVDPSQQRPVTDRIHNLINKADIVVADMSTKNPEIFYEAGYAHALGRSVILLTRTAEDIPFDLKQHPHIIYEKSVSKLKSMLTKRLRWLIANPDRHPADSEFALHLYADGKLLQPDASPRTQTKAPMRQTMSGGGEGLVIDLDVHNPTDRPFSSDISIAVVTEDLERNESGAKVVTLPEGKFMHVFRRDVAILPDCWYSIRWELRNPLTLFHWGTQFEIDVAVYTELQRFEYPLSVEGVRP
jgi:hypothetical protein